MSEADRKHTDDLLNAYLDGTLDALRRAEFEAALEDDPALRRSLELQERIEASLQRLAVPSELPPAHLEALRAELESGRLGTSLPADISMRLRWLYRVAAVLMLTASSGFFWWTAQNKAPDPVFAQRPVAAIYQEIVTNGFKPYYECHDVERFSITFQRRQGRPLWLLHPPPGIAMLGLDYPGGISGDTTGMLCHVDGRPVMVFVDLLSHDSEVVGRKTAADSNVFREERFGLVFYEVTPWDAAHCIELFSDQYADGAAVGAPAP